MQIAVKVIFLLPFPSIRSNRVKPADWSVVQANRCADFYDHKPKRLALNNEIRALFS